MGATLAIENRTDEMIYVKWYGPAELIEKLSYTVRPGEVVPRSKNAVWYKVVINYKGQVDEQMWYGGTDSYWWVDNNGIQWKPSRSSQQGGDSIRIPWSHPALKAIAAQRDSDSITISRNDPLLKEAASLKRGGSYNSRL